MILGGFWEALGDLGGSKKGEKGAPKASSKKYLILERLREGFGRVLGEFWDGFGRLGGGFWEAWGGFGEGLGASGRHFGGIFEVS